MIVATVCGTDETSFEPSGEGTRGLITVSWSGPTHVISPRETRGVELPEIQFAVSDGHRIAWQQWGSGPDVLMIPAIISNIELLWEQELYRRALEYYGEHLRITMYDKRGIGLSDRYIDPLTRAERVTDTLAVMDAAGLDRPTVQGTSEGGLIALLFALAHPDRVDRLIATNPSPGNTGWTHLLIGSDGSTDATDELIARYAHLVEVWGTDPQLFVDWYNPAQSSNPAFVRWMGRYCRQSATGSDLAAHIASTGQLAVDSELSQITAPTLVVHYTDDHVVPIDGGRWLAARIPGALFRELAGSDHFGLADPGWRDLADLQIEFVTGGRPDRATERRLATVLFTDIVDSTDKTAQAGDDAWRRTLDSHDRIAWRTANEYHGTLVKNTGDGLLMRFEAPAPALDFARELRARLSSIGLPIRCGIHTGEIELRSDGDITGVAVNLAARVEQASDDGAIFVSSTVRDLLLGGGTRFEDRGEHTLKGFDTPWRLFALAE